MRSALALVFLIPVAATLSAQGSFLSFGDPVAVEQGVAVFVGSDDELRYFGYGSVDSFGGHDVGCYRLTYDGAILGARYFGTAEDDVVKRVEPMSDDFWLCGYSGALDARATIWHTDHDGRLLDSWVYDPTPAQEVFSDLCPSGDGGWIAVGHRKDDPTNDALIVRWSAAGDTLWTRILSTPELDYLVGVAPLAGGGYVAVGDRFDDGLNQFDAYVVRFDADGNILADEPVGRGSNGGMRQLRRLNDGGFIAVGEAVPPAGPPFDFYMLGLDSGGNPEWSQYVGGTGTDAAFDLVQIDDDLLAISGFYTTPLGETQAAVAITDRLGVVDTIVHYGNPLFDVAGSVSHDGIHLFASGNTFDGGVQYALLREPIAAWTGWSPSPIPDSNRSQWMRPGDCRWLEAGRWVVVDATGRMVREWATGTGTFCLPGELSGALYRVMQAGR